MRSRRKTWHQNKQAARLANNQRFASRICWRSLTIRTHHQRVPLSLRAISSFLP